jgi:hypothetical protein
MAQFDSKYVVCPYYHSNDNNRVCCDGVTDGNTVNVVFGDPTKRKKYMECYCNSIEKYSHCKICNMLHKKWSDDSV